MASIKPYKNHSIGFHSYGDGLFLQVYATGRSVWVLRLNVDGRRTKRILGNASPAFNLDAARRAAADKKAESKTGGLSIRQPVGSGTNTTGSTVGILVTQWADGMLAQDRWTKRHHQKTVARIELHTSGLWRCPVAGLSRPEINRELAKIESVDTAGRVFGWIKEAFEDAVDRGDLDFCVLGRRPKAFLVTKKNKQTRKSYGTDFDKLRALYKKIRISDNARAVRQAGQISILTGLRLGEVIGLRSDYFDGSVLLIPRAEMKEKDTWRADFTVPLSPPALEIIEESAASSVDGWLFVGPKSGRPISHEGVERMFRKFSNREHVPHGTRTSLYTWALELETPVNIADSLIDHATSKGTGGHYDQTQYIPQRTRLLEQWAELIAL